MNLIMHSSKYTIAPFIYLFMLMLWCYTLIFLGLHKYSFHKLNYVIKICYTLMLWKLMISLWSYKFLALQVILNPLILQMSLNEVKDILVWVLRPHGQLSETLVIYGEINQAGRNLEAKDVRSHCKVLNLSVIFI